MSTNYVKCLKRFHAKHGAVTNLTPTVPDPDVVTLRLRLIAEEFVELCTAFGRRADVSYENAQRESQTEFNDIVQIEDARVGVDRDRLVEIADALGDLLYVTFGAAVTCGIPMDKVFAEIQRSNMSKAAISTSPTDKVEKGASFDPPHLMEILFPLAPFHTSDGSPIQLMDTPASDFLRESDPALQKVLADQFEQGKIGSLVENFTILPVEKEKP